MAGSSLLSNPEVSIVVEGAGNRISNKPQRALIVALLDGANGTAVAGELNDNIPQDDASIDALFGPKSQLALACRNFRKVNDQTVVDAIGIAPSGTASAGVFTISGTASANGTISFVVGSAIDFKYEVVVAAGDSPTVVGDALVAAITADARSQVTAINAAGVVTVTAYQAGICGDGIAIQVVGGSSVAGISAVVTTAMTGGAGDPSSAGDFDVVADRRYQTVIYPGEWDLSNLTGFLNPRFNTQNNILDGVGIVTLYDTYTNILALNEAQNSQSLVTLNFPLTDEASYKGISMAELPIGIAAQMGAARALRLTDGALISDLLVGAMGFDAQGGTALATRPYFNTPFPNLPLIALDKGWSQQEVEGIGSEGGSTIGSNLDRTAVIAGELYTTYKTDAAGNPDDSFNFLNKVDAAVNAREYFFNNIKAEYAQIRLTAGDLVPGRPMTNKTQIRGFLMSLYRDLSENQYVITVAGSEAEKVFAENLIIEIDFSAGAVDVVFNRVPLVSQFREFFGTFKIAFEV